MYTLKNVVHFYFVLWGIFYLVGFIVWRLAERRREQKENENTNEEEINEETTGQAREGKRIV